MKDIVKDLEALWRMERSRHRLIKEGDRNTTYFQAMANQKHRKRRISGLEGPEGWIEDNQLMLVHAINFYKNQQWGRASVDFWEDSELVTPAENELFEANFSEEVREAVFGSYAEGAPDPDGFSFLSIRCSRLLLKRLNESDPHV